MIVGVYETYTVGQRYRRMVTDGQQRPHRGVWFLVLREATEAEWIAWCRAQGNEPDWPDRGRAGARYYEISTD